MSVSQYASSLLGGTCTHSTTLKKGNDFFTGIYNGLSYWGRVEDHDGNFVEEFGVAQEEDDSQSCFTAEDFELLGDYEIVNA